MRITCQTLDGFLGDLKTSIDEASPNVVLQRTVRVEVYERSMEEKPVRDSIRVQIVIQASAVVAMGDDGEYLLQFGQDCGIDYNDGSGEMNGTIKANKLRAKIQEFCDDEGLRIGPGTIEP